jgi:beta-lactamase regulating signal transducer with metallopeptidase domain
MSEWFLWLANPFDDLTGLPRFVFVVLWQSTMIAAGAVLLATLARRPATKAWILLLGLCAAFVAPLATTAVRAMGGGVIADDPTVVSVTPEFSVEPVQTKSLRERNDDATIAAYSKASTSNFVEPIASKTAFHEFPVVGDGHSFGELAANLVVIAWLALSLLFGVRLMRSSWSMRLVLRRAERCGDLRVSDITSSIALRYGIKPPAVLLCDSMQSPAVFGVRKPVVLVSRSDEQLFPPTGAFPASAWEAVLRHELAHVRRRDPLARAAVELIVALMPLPATWLLRRKFYATAEEACDDWAVFDGTKALDLAALLTDYASTFSPTPIGNAMDSSDTKRRILRLLSTRESKLASPTGRWRKDSRSAPSC